MGGKGSSGPSQHQSRAQAPATGDKSGGQQRQQQSQSRSFQPQQQSRPQPTERDRLRIPENQTVNLYAPQRKPSPVAPMPARVGVRAERQAFQPDPNLKFSEKEISGLYAGSKYDPKLRFSEEELDGLFGTGGGGGSILGSGVSDFNQLGY